MLDWDHNAYYHRLLLRHLPQNCRRVLDVGCGAGEFATKLAHHADHVDAVDRSPEMITLAGQHAPQNVSCVLADLPSDALPSGDYDAIFSISALHHMHLPQVLPQLANALRPGGILAAVALPRIDLPRDLPIELTAALGHRLFGAAFALARTVGSANWYPKAPAHGIMPVFMDPSLTTRQVQRQAEAVLPGVRVRRLVFWRYLLLWQKPTP